MINRSGTGTDVEWWVVVSTDRKKNYFKIILCKQPLRKPYSIKMSFAFQEVKDEA
jgi:hypothetical protein